MEGGHEDVLLAREHHRTLVESEFFNRGACSQNPRCTDENGVKGLLPEGLSGDVHLAALQLAAVGVALHVDVDQIQ